MTQITLHATPALKTDSHGFTGVSYMLTDLGKLGQEKVETNTLSAISKAVAYFGERTKIAHPTASFLVSVSWPKGFRKIPGFDKENNKADGFGARVWLMTEKAYATQAAA